MTLLVQLATEVSALGRGLDRASPIAHDIRVLATRLRERSRTERWVEADMVVASLNSAMASGSSAARLAAVREVIAALKAEQPDAPDALDEARVEAIVTARFEALAKELRGRTLGRDSALVAVADAIERCNQGRA